MGQRGWGRPAEKGFWFLERGITFVSRGVVGPYAAVHYWLRGFGDEVLELEDASLSSGKLVQLAERLAVVSAEADCRASKEVLLAYEINPQRPVLLPTDPVTGLIPSTLKG